MVYEGSGLAGMMKISVLLAFLSVSYGSVFSCTDRYQEPSTRSFFSRNWWVCFWSPYGQPSSGACSICDQGSGLTTDQRIQPAGGLGDLSDRLYLLSSKVLNTRDLRV